MAERDKIYFASDIHLGMYPREQSLEREKLFVRWLDEIKADAKVIYLVGDIFDYWYEYKTVVPRGFTRFLGKLSEITDSGVEVHFFTGNHDIWVFDYLPQECGVLLHHEAVVKNYNGYKFFIAHGDGLGPGDYNYKLLKCFFTSKFLQFLYSKIHPNISMRFAHSWSKRRRYSKGFDEEFLGENKEFPILYAKSLLKEEPYDFFVFGHRHLPLDYKIGNSTRVIYLGDWITNFTYGVLDGKDFSLKKYQ
jgi:UDP-2,3-diacylglucosamine hydrolase